MMIVFFIFIGWVFSETLRIDPNTLRFITTEGVELHFHGVNAVVKSPPYHPTTDEWDPMYSFTEDDAVWLRMNGFNLLRLGVMMPGVLPELNVVNQTYLNQIEMIVNTAGKHGIYTMLDFHQDLLTARCCGEGVPDYLIPSDLNPETPFPNPVAKNKYNVDDDGNPTRDECDQLTFGLYYLAHTTGDVFDMMYENLDPYEFSQQKGSGTRLLDYIAFYWTEVARAFRTNKYVIGYDIINEPFPGNLIKHPEREIFGAKFDREVLAPTYRRMMEAIWAVDRTHIIFFEPSVSSVSPTGFGNGGPGAALGIPAGQSAYSFHVYCPLINGTADPLSRPACDRLDPFFFNTRKNDYINMGVGGILSEFGAVTEHEAGLDEMEWVMSLADSAGVSWVYWQYKGYGDITSQCMEGEGLFNADGTVQTEKMSRLSYPYVQRVDGILLHQNFDRETRVYTFTYKAGGSSPEGTVVYLSPQFTYPGGYSMVYSPPTAGIYIKHDRYKNLSIFGAPFGMEINIVFSPL